MFVSVPSQDMDINQFNHPLYPCPGLAQTQKCGVVKPVLYPCPGLAQTQKCGVVKLVYIHVLAWHKHKKVGWLNWFISMSWLGTNIKMWGG
jgi:hypothetical protein